MGQTEKESSKQKEWEDTEATESKGQEELWRNSHQMRKTFSKRGKAGNLPEELLFCFFVL
ncbi:MAG: hypothetical protein ACLTXL_14835 [Clostridia bacterium]